MKPYYFIFLILCCLSCNKNPYLSANDYAISQEHKIVAVLPIEVVTTGNLQKDLTVDEIERINQKESEYFQEILTQSVLYKKKFTSYEERWVDVLPTYEVNQILHDNKITIENLGLQTPSKIAELLGVDGLIFAKVKKERYMSEEASVMIDASEQIFNAIFKNDLPISLSKKTYDVDLRLSIVDGKRNETIYKRHLEKGIHYTSDPEDAFSELVEEVSRHLPYSEYTIKQNQKRKRIN